MKRTEQLRELRALSTEKISGKIQEYRKALVVKNQDKVLGKLKSSAEIRTLRLSISRAQTILEEKIRESISK